MTTENAFSAKYHYAVNVLKVKVITKRQYYWFWRAIDIVLKVITFGKQDRFLTNYTTTIGNVIAFPINFDLDNADNSSYSLFCHELCHVDQAKQMGLGCIWLGTIIHSLLYLTFPLPVLFAWYRWKCEREAYLVGWKAANQIGRPLDITYAIDELSGPNYGWTWVIRSQVKRWFFKHCV